VRRKILALGIFVAGCALALCLAIAHDYTKALTEQSQGMAEPEPGARQPATCKTDLASQLRRLDVPGLAVGIVKNGRVICTGVAGMANIEQKKPVTADTLFMIASISKVVTATALMQLQEEGKFKLDDDVNRYLPFRVSIPESPASPITFRQLLTHTSSIRDNSTYINCPLSCDYGSELGDYVTRGADSPISLAEFTRGYLTPGGAYYDADDNFDSDEPGTSSRYSNMGIVLAGYLVEVISGVPFDKYCKDHIFTPLGMNKTSWRLAGIDQSILAMPYDKDSSGFVPYGQFGEPDYPDGMVRTSVNELARFMIAYMQSGRFENKQILKAGTVQEMLKSQTPLSSRQGLAWSTRSISRSSNGWKVWGHDGSDNGAGAKMWFDPGKKVGVILVTNGMWDEDRASTLFTTLFRESDGY